MKKLKNAFFKSMLIVLFVFTIYVTYCSIFKIYKNNLELKPVIIIMGAIVLIFVFIHLKRIIDKLSEKKSNIVAIILCFIFLVFLIIFGMSITSIPVEDLSNIQAEVGIMMENGGKLVTEEYFMKYPNQKSLAILVYFIYRIGAFLNIQNLKIFSMGINAFFTSITAFFTYLTVKQIKDYKIGLVTLIFFVINPIFYLYISYFYSDMLCMLFAIIGIYMLIVSINEKRIKKKIMKEIVATIFIAIGAKIRIVVAFLLVAFLLYLVLSEEKNRQKILQLTSIILTFILAIILFSTIIKSFDNTHNTELEFPVFHWIMMGLNEEKDGIWNFDDYMYTYNNKTNEEKTKKDIEKIKERINKLGIGGIISLSKTKLAVNWSNGDYDYLGKLLNTEQVNVLYNYVSGNKRIFISYYAQVCKVVMFIILLFVILIQFNKLEDNQIILFIAILEAFVFYLIWEVSPRYSLSFLPWLILAFGIGIEYIQQILEFEFLIIKRRNHLKKLILKLISVAMIGTTMILIVVNYNKYAIEKTTKWDTRVMQWRKQGKTIEVNFDKKIEQTFKTDKKFNSISIVFNNNKAKTNTKYQFILKNNKNEIIVKQEFTSDSIKSGDYKTFMFNNIKPKDEQKYIIEITSNNAAEEDSIGIESFYQENYDTYPNGNVKINGKDINADLTFKVQYKTKRTIISKRIYILLCFIIIFIELFAFYPYLNYNRRELLSKGDES